MLTAAGTRLKTLSVLDIILCRGWQESTFQLQKV